MCPTRDSMGLDGYLGAVRFRRLRRFRVLATSFDDAGPASSRWVSSIAFWLCAIVAVISASSLWEVSSFPWVCSTRVRVCPISSFVSSVSPFINDMTRFGV